MDQHEKDVQRALGFVQTYDVYLRNVHQPICIMVEAVDFDDAVDQAKRLITKHKIVRVESLADIIYEAYLRGNNERV